MLCYRVGFDEGFSRFVVDARLVDVVVAIVDALLW